MDKQFFFKKAFFESTGMKMIASALYLWQAGIK